MPTTSSCFVCGRNDTLVAVRVDDGTRPLCASHHAALGADADRTFPDEAALLSHPGLDRRDEGERRAQERRMFPRPEGRRRDRGRRADDPRV
ncbi:MAG: hypothetical protein RIF41_02890 [Polyangiaceae bacterium]